jgi:hypothetical protein
MHKFTLTLAGALALTFLSGAASASLVPTGGDPFPAGSFFNLTGPAPVEVRNPTITNFQLLSAIQGSVGQDFAYSANFIAQIVDPTSQALIGVLDLPSSVFDFEIKGRTLSNPLGTFSTSLNSAQFAGTFLGHTVDVAFNGSGTLIFLNQGNGLLVDNSDVLNAQYSIDGSAITDAGQFLGVLAAAPVGAPGPAPGAGLLGLAALLGAGLLARARGGLAG